MGEFSLSKMGTTGEVGSDKHDYFSVAGLPAGEECHIIPAYNGMFWTIHWFMDGTLKPIDVNHDSTTPEKALALFEKLRLDARAR